MRLQRIIIQRSKWGIIFLFLKWLDWITFSFVFSVVIFNFVAARLIFFYLLIFFYFLIMTFNQIEILLILIIIWIFRFLLIFWNILKLNIVSWIVLMSWAFFALCFFKHLLLWKWCEQFLRITEIQKVFKNNFTFIIKFWDWFLWLNLN